MESFAGLVDQMTATSFANPIWHGARLCLHW